MIGPIGFLNPLLLGALVALPLIWWLLRAVPPRPQTIAFPPTRILVGLEDKEKTSAKTPWWLTLIRMLAAALVILALAEPVLNPERKTPLAGTGPIAVVVDNGWASAAHWPLRQQTLERVLAEAESHGRAVVVVPTASAARQISLKLEAPGAARATLAAIRPEPFDPRRDVVIEKLDELLANGQSASIVWLSDGIDHDEKTRAFADGLVRLARSDRVTVIESGAGQEALGLRAGLGKGGRLEGEVLRVSGPLREGIVHALSARGQRLSEARFKLDVGATAAKFHFDLPLELRNQVTRVELSGERSAGAVHLLDARSQWQRIGLLSGVAVEEAQPLLAPLYYIERALLPFAEVASANDANVARALDDLFSRNISILALADIGTLTGEVMERVDNWVKDGGVLVRFAGPRLEKGGDELLPVALRLGGRTLGGALSWSTPQKLAGFASDSLFAGLAVPPEVQVRRQVLADPGRLGPEVKIWARLEDGTPLVTAAKRGEGDVILFHVTANSDWSNLPLSGLFVEMLRRIATLGRTGGVASVKVADAVSDAKTAKTATASATAEVLAPIQVLDGYGDLKPPPPTAQAIAQTKLQGLRPSAEHPPGYYGPQGTPRALNILDDKRVLLPLPSLPSGVDRRVLDGAKSQPLKPWLLGSALALLFTDIIAIVLLQAGGLAGVFGRPAGARAAIWIFAVVASALAAGSGPVVAQGQRPVAATGSDQIGIRATGKVTLGYVLTGDRQTDETSRLGLIGLGKILAARTAVEPGEPLSVNIDADEIAFYPVLYWPVLPNATALGEKTLAKIDAYMKQGGMIVFDTRDHGQGLPTGFGVSPDGGTSLQRLLGRLDIPRLEPVPEGHVLTKAFYLLRSFPGRWDGGQLWVEAQVHTNAEQGRQARQADGVSAVLVTANDFAAAWALDEQNRPLYPTVPGGEQQREMAFRAGVNIVMHALTGNYKADQVHVPALLERLGQ